MLVLTCNTVCLCMQTLATICQLLLVLSGGALAAYIRIRFPDVIAGAHSQKHMPICPNSNMQMSGIGLENWTWNPGDTLHTHQNWAATKQAAATAMPLIALLLVLLNTDAHLQRGNDAVSYNICPLCIHKTT